MAKADTHAELLGDVEAHVRHILGVADGAPTPALVDRRVMVEITGRPSSWWERRATQGRDPSIKIGRAVKYDWKRVLRCIAAGDLK